MSKNFPKKEELETMSTAAIRSQVPYGVEDEALMAEVLAKRAVPMQHDEQINMNDIKNAVINTPEEEAKWQAILDGRREAVKERVLGKEVVLNDKIEKLEEEKEKLEEEIKTLEPEVTITPMPDIEWSEPLPEKIGEAELVKVEEKVDARSSIKCELCGSKSKVFHKRGCPTLIKE